MMKGKIGFQIQIDLGFLVYLYVIRTAQFANHLRGFDELVHRTYKIGVGDIIGWLNLVKPMANITF